MFLSLIQLRTSYRATLRWLWCGLLAICLGFFSTTASSGDNVWFQDHFGDENSLPNWTVSGNARIEDRMLRLWTCTWHYYCESLGEWAFDSFVLLNQSNERNFELTAQLNPSDPTSGRIIFNATDYAIDRGKAYSVSFGNTDSTAADLASHFNQAILRRMDIDPLGIFPYGAESTIVATSTFDPVNIPAVARLVVTGGKIQVFLKDKKILSFNDQIPLPAGMVGLGTGYDGSTAKFDDFTLVALPDLRCSTDARVDGKDRICQGGLFEHKLWVYLGPDNQKTARVDFYLDGKFRRSEFHAPWELDGGSMSTLLTGPHEIKAKVHYKDGTGATLYAGFEVGENSLRCSPDPVLDGNDAACDGGTFDAPTWAYWWPETGVKSIDYFVDGIFHRTERLPPFELDGGVSSALLPVRYYAYSDSQIKAVVQFKDGRQPLTIESKASVQQSAPAQILCSSDETLDGADPRCADSDSGLPRVYLWPEDGVDRADFYVDGKFHRTERYSPYELDGGAWTTLPAGRHAITAVIDFTDREKPTTAITSQIYVFQ